MAVSSSSVEIRINVVDSNTQQTVAQLKSSMDQLGGAGAGAGSKIKEGMKGAEAGVLSMHQKTHLLTEELGVHIPRAFLRLVSESKAAQQVINGLAGAMVGLGAVQIGAMIFTQLYDGAKKLWENYLSLNSAQDEYQKSLDKMKAEDYWKSDSIETTTLRIREATDAAKGYRSIAEGMNKDAWSMILSGNQGNMATGIGMLYGAHKLAGESVKNQESVDKLTPQQAAQKHELTIEQINLNHALDGELQHHQKINAELQKHKEINAEARRYDNEKNSALGNKVAPDAGAAKEKMENQIAKREADAENFNISKSQNEELKRIHESALESSLRGSALYAAQEARAIEELKEKGISSAAAVNDIHAKFHNEEMKRVKEQEDEIAKMREATALAGLTGTTRAHQEELNKVNDLMRDPKGANPGQLLAKINEIHQETARQIGEINKTFADRVDTITATVAERELSGFAKIRADAQKQITELTKDFEKNGGNRADLDRGVGAINAGASGQEAELRRKNMQETEQIEAEARSKSLSDEKNKSAAIYSEYDERVRKYKAQLDQQAISEEDFNRRVAAAAELRDAEMVEASKAAHAKMAGEFDSLFKSLDHPMKALQEMGNKVAANYAATLVQKFQQHGGHGASTADTGDGGLLGSIFGGHGFGGKNPIAHATTHTAATNKVMALQSATIHVQSANIALGGAGGTRGGSEYGMAGGTSLAAGGGGTSYGISSGSTATAGTGSFGGGGTTGAGSAGGAGIASAMGTASAGLNLAKDASKEFTGKDSPISKIADSKAGQKIGGAASAGMGLYSAFEGNGGIGGALQGGMAGMKLGAELGGPMGAAIGLVGGAIMGAMGFGGRSKAEAYYKKTVKPRLGNDMDSFQQGGMDYLSAYADMQSLDMEAKKTTNAMGPGGQGYYQDTIKAAIQQSEEKLTREQKAGRSASTVSAAQFDVGGPIGGFGAMTTDSDHGWIHAQRGEFMVHQAAAIPHYQALQAINGGASHSDMAQYYGGGRGDQVMPTQSSDVTHNWTVHAVDSKSFADMLRNNPHAVRGALNLSQEQYGGLADA